MRCRRRCRTNSKRSKICGGRRRRRRTREEEGGRYEVKNLSPHRQQSSPSARHRPRPPSPLSEGGGGRTPPGLPRPPAEKI